MTPTRRSLGLALGLLGLGAALAWAGWTSARAAPQDLTLTVEASEFAYAPAEIQAQAGEAISLTLKNVGAAPHDIVFELDGGREARTPRIMGGQQTGLAFDAPLVPGDYVYYCAVGNHRDRGMVGKLVVAAATQPLSVTVDASEFAFAPSEIRAPASAAISLTLKNIGAAPHDIVFELDGGREARTPRINGGQEAALMFDAPAAAGEYVFYCSVGNHRQRGMEGKLVIEGAAPTEVPPPATPDYPVAVGDLNSPHGISVLAEPPGGAWIAVSEGGTGDPVPGEFAPGNADGRVQIMPLADPSMAQVIASGLTNSQDPGGGIVGANHALALGDPLSPVAASMLVAQAGGPGHARPEDAAKILKVTGVDRQVTVLADTLAYEREHNPGGEEGEEGIDSNPWRMVRGPDDMIYITDAGANDLLKMDPATGALSTYAVFAPIDDGQAVPTGLAFASDDTDVLYVAQLAFSAPPRPIGQIRRLVDANGDGDALDEGENTLFIDGLVLPTDIAFDPEGHLYVTEIAPATLSRIDPACWSPGMPCPASAKVVVAGGLYAASAIAFLANGDALVTAGPAAPPPFPALKTDRIVRIPAGDLVPAPTPTPVEPSPTAPPPLPTDTPTPPDEGCESCIYLPLGLRDAPMP